MPEVEIVDRKFLERDEPAARRGEKRRDHHAIAMAREVAADHSAAGTLRRQTRGENQVWRGEGAGGENDRVGAHGASRATVDIHRLHRGDAVAPGVKPEDRKST